MNSIGEEYKGLLDEYCARLQEFEEVIRGLKTRERNLLARRDDDHRLAFSLNDLDVGNKIYKTKVNVFDQMIDAAEKRFSPVGSRLKIKREEVLRALALDGQEAWRTFDPVRVWRYLEEQYGGAKGEEVAWQQTAKALIDAFNIRNDKPVRTVGAQVVLDMSVYLDSFDKKYGKNRLHYHSSEKVGKALTALIGFANWGSLDLAENGLYLAMRELCNTQHEIQSRKTYGGGGIHIITYQNRFEFRFERRIAEQLQIFIGSFGDL